MKLIYLTAEGIAYAEDLKPFKRNVEVKGGDYHPIVPGAVWRDEQRKFPPMMFIWQGRRWPEGAELSAGKMPALEANIAKLHDHPVSISKYWLRALVRYCILFFKFMVLGVVISIITFMLVLISRLVI